MDAINVQKTYNCINVKQLWSFFFWHGYSDAPIFEYHIQCLLINRHLPCEIKRSEESFEPFVAHLLCAYVVKVARNFGIITNAALARCCNSNATRYPDGCERNK